MKDKNKLIVLVSGVLVILLMIVSVSFAIFRFGEESTNQELVLGDIWMKYTESNGISLENSLPGDEYTNYFEFTITGTNTYTKKDIYYDISLTHGDTPAGKTEENRIEDKYLKFKLTEVNGNTETEIFTDKTYDDLTNKRVHVDTISKSTNEYSKTYRLYMVISGELTYGNSSDAILSTEEFGKIFGSIKVNVTGDFNEKELELEATDASCFEVVETTFHIRNENMTEEELTLCETYFTNFVNEDKYDDFVLAEDSTARSFCEGTGKITGYWDNDNTLQDYLNYEVNGFEEEDFDYLVDNNIVIRENGVAIYGYDESCGSDVIIPNQINGNNVLKLDGFSHKNLTSVILPNGVRVIETSAFLGNSLTKLTLPSTVFFTRPDAFSYNQISKLVIEDGVKIIGGWSFGDNLLTEVTLPNSIEMYSCEAFGYEGEVNVVASNGLSCGTGGKSFYEGGNG